ncbi:hypothetical protein EKD04_004780 [Chloroflexales bacterium ZM16-3]|nr:hypothetical protein [Chloroflexales bacterium ZM16-3]
MTGNSPIFLVPEAEGEPLLAAVERGLRDGGADLSTLPTLGGLAQDDPFFAEQMAGLHQGWEIRPGPAHGPLARLRTRLAWWLLGPELAQASATHAALVRVIDSLTSHLDSERAARARLEARLAALERPR